MQTAAFLCGNLLYFYFTTHKLLVPYEMFDGYVLLNGAKAYTDNRLVYDREISSEIYIPFLKNLSKNNLKVAAEINGIH